MAIRKIPSGWQADINPTRSKRVRRNFKTKAEAVRFERITLEKYAQGEDINPKKDKRRLSELIKLHYDLHGQHLKSGLERKKKLYNLARVAGDPEAYKLTASWFVQLRQLRAQTVKANTLNHDRAYLHALFSDLINLGLWNEVNPIAKTRPVKFSAAPVTFLSLEEIHCLLDQAKQSRNRHLYLIIRICLETGARWSEAEQLQVSQFKNNTISFWETKSGKPRHIPISDKLAYLLKNHNKHGFNRFFSGSYDAFTNALEKTGIKLPAGQRTHVLRHSFASHFVLNGGDLLELKEILGHSSLAMTMRYAHFAKGHLSNAKLLNPLA